MKRDILVTNNNNNNDSNYIQSLEISLTILHSVV